MSVVLLCVLYFFPPFVFNDVVGTFKRNTVFTLQLFTFPKLLLQKESKLRITEMQNFTIDFDWHLAFSAFFIFLYSLQVHFFVSPSHQTVISLITVCVPLIYLWISGKHHNCEKWYWIKRIVCFFLVVFGRDSGDPSTSVVFRLSNCQWFLFVLFFVKLDKHRRLLPLCHDSSSRINLIYTTPK